MKRETKYIDVLTPVQRAFVDAIASGIPFKESMKEVGIEWPTVKAWNTANAKFRWLLADAKEEGAKKRWILRKIDRITERYGTEVQGEYDFAELLADRAWARHQCSEVRTSNPAGKSPNGGFEKQS